MTKTILKGKIKFGIVCGLLLMIFPIADAESATLYDYTFPSDTQSWVYAGTCSGGSCTLTRGWNSTDGIPPGSLYFNQSTTTGANRNTESAWSSPDLAWSNGIPTSAKLNFSYRVMVEGASSSVTIRAYIIKTDNTGVLVYQGSAITTNTSWIDVSVPVGTDNFTTAGNYKIRLNGTLFTTNPGTAAVRWDTANLTLIWETPQTYIPPAPSGLTPAQNNFWINYTWEAGTPGNATDSYNVSVEGESWTNSTTTTHHNSTVGAHGWSNITVYAFNNSGGGSLSSTPATSNTQVANNVPVLGSIGNREVTAGQLLTITISATDADSDPLTNATNATKGSFTSPDVYTWTPGDSDVGTHLWEFNTSDNYGGIDSETITVTVNAATYVPAAPVITEISQANFWINYTWVPGSGFNTDSYNVSVNDLWTNGTTETFNLSNVGPHGWSNITVYAFNNSGGGSLSSTPATNNTQVANNDPILAAIEDRTITAGNLLTFYVSATDADSDPLTNSTNATKGTFDPVTGIYSWMPESADVNAYFWEFSADDGYGSPGKGTTTINVTPASGIYINGTVKSGGTGVEGVTVSTNTSINTTTDASGFYSLPVTSGAYELTAALEPVYYTNSSVTAVVETGVVVREIELAIKPTGTITGSVRNG